MVYLTLPDVLDIQNLKLKYTVGLNFCKIKVEVK